MDGVLPRVLKKFKPSYLGVKFRSEEDDDGVFGQPQDRKVDNIVDVEAEVVQGLDQEHIVVGPPEEELPRSVPPADIPSYMGVLLNDSQDADADAFRGQTQDHITANNILGVESEVAPGLDQQHVGGDPSEVDPTHLDQHADIASDEGVRLNETEEEPRPMGKPADIPSTFANHEIRKTLLNLDTGQFVRTEGSFPEEDNASGQVEKNTLNGEITETFTTLRNIITCAISADPYGTYEDESVTPSEDRPSITQHSPTYAVFACSPVQGNTFSINMHDNASIENEEQLQRDNGEAESDGHSESLSSNTLMRESSHIEPVEQFHSDHGDNASDQSSDSMDDTQESEPEVDPQGLGTSHGPLVVKFAFTKFCRTQSALGNLDNYLQNRDLESSGAANDTTTQIGGISVDASMSEEDSCAIDQFQTRNTPMDQQSPSTHDSSSVDSVLSAPEVQPKEPGIECGFKGTFDDFNSEKDLSSVSSVLIVHEDPPKEPRLQNAFNVTINDLSSENNSLAIDSVPICDEIMEDLSNTGKNVNSLDREFISPEGPQEHRAVPPLPMRHPSSRTSDNLDVSAALLPPTHTFSYGTALAGNEEILEDHAKCSEEYWAYQQITISDCVCVERNTITSDTSQYTTLRGRVLGPLCDIGSHVLELTGQILQDTHVIAGSRDLTGESEPQFAHLKGVLSELQSVVVSLQTET